MTTPETSGSGAACELTPKDRRNQWAAVIWLFAWLLSCALAPIALRRELLPDPLEWLTVALPILLGIPAFLTFRRFVMQTDELLRKIQMEALAFGFGVGVVASVTLELVSKSGGPTVDIGFVSAAMLAAYALAVLVGTRRYA